MRHEGQICHYQYRSYFLIKFDRWVEKMPFNKHCKGQVWPDLKNNISTLRTAWKICSNLNKSHVFGIVIYIRHISGFLLVVTWERICPAVCGVPVSSLFHNWAFAFTPPHFTDTELIMLLLWPDSAKRLYRGKGDYAMCVIKYSVKRLQTGPSHVSNYHKESIWEWRAAPQSWI